MIEESLAGGNLQHYNVGFTRLRDWLERQRVTTIGMESTGVYWEPVYYDAARSRLGSFPSLVIFAYRAEKRKSDEMYPTRP